MASATATSSSGPSSKGMKYDGCSNTGAGGMLQTVLGGFGGLEITNEGIVQGKINKPKTWKKFEVKRYYKKHEK